MSEVRGSWSGLCVRGVRSLFSQLEGGCIQLCGCGPEENPRFLSLRKSSFEACCGVDAVLWLPQTLTYEKMPWVRVRAQRVADVVLAEEVETVLKYFEMTL